VQRSFGTPDSKVAGEGAFLFIVNGNNNYSIPLGSDGIPEGAQLTFFQFLELGNENNCNKRVSNINHLQINRQFVGIATDPADSCEHNCDDASGTEE
jgi:hypothetical protein